MNETNGTTEPVAITATTTSEVTSATRVDCAANDCMVPTQPWHAVEPLRTPRGGFVQDALPLLMPAPTLACDEDFLFDAMMRQAVIAGTPMVRFRDYGIADEDIVKLVQDHGALPVLIDDEDVSLWQLPNTLFTVTQNVHKVKGKDVYEVTVAWRSLSKDETRWYLETVKPKLQPKRLRSNQPRGNVNMLVSTFGGPKFREVGRVCTTLERENYTKETLAAFDHVVADLNSDTPTGRIAIFDGPPGTGKSFMLRALLSLVPNALFVLVPPKLVGSICDPEFIDSLREMQENRGGARLVMILEDADEVLAPRHAKNLDALANALNLGDGMIGDLVNIRIVASTNTPIRKLDAALRRPRRLSARVQVGRLPAWQARRVFSRLLAQSTDIEQNNALALRGLAKRFLRGAALAEVYEAAQASGWQEPANARGVINPEAELEVVAVDDATDDDDDE